MVVRCIQVVEGMLLLVSENPACDIELVAGEGVIIGRVVGAWQRFG